MRPRNPSSQAFRARSHASRAVLAAGVALLTGCAFLQAGSLVASRQAAPAAAHETASTRTWRIVQRRIGGETAFLLAASEPAPTPKTGAAKVHATPTAAAPDSPRPITNARVREPAGAVYFALAGTRLDQAALPTVAAAAARAGRADRVVLTAYTDPSGTLAENRRLAGQRADAVTDALAARGIEPAQVIVISRPQCCAPRPLPERDAAAYRRVDIEILTHRRVPSSERSDDPQSHS